MVAKIKKEKKQSAKIQKQNAKAANPQANATKKTHHINHAELIKQTVVGVGIIILTLLALDFLSAEFPQTFQGAQDFIQQNGLVGVFVIVFLGASMLPFPTDLAYSVAIKLFAQNPLPVIAVSIVAAFLGSLLNYGLARLFREKFIARFLSDADLMFAEDLFDKWGPVGILILGIIPASPVFDPLTFVAGLVKMDVKKFALYSFMSRVLHFGILAALVLAFKLV